MVGACNRKKKIFAMPFLKKFIHANIITNPWPAVMCISYKINKNAYAEKNLAIWQRLAFMTLWSFQWFVDLRTPCLIISLKFSMFEASEERNRIKTAKLRWGGGCNMRRNKMSCLSWEQFRVKIKISRN